jgi:hypothetical protein
MAAKAKMMKLLQEIRGFAEISNRRPQSRSPGLFLMQLRSHTTHTTLPPRRRSILIDVQDLSEIPHPVKITHLGDNPAQPVRL